MMTCNRRTLDGAPSPQAKRQKKDNFQPERLKSQPSLTHDSSRASWRVPIEPLVAPRPVSPFENSLPSFTGLQTTHPSAGNQTSNNSLPSGSTSRLESKRGLSVLTPTTPTASGDGDLAGSFGIVQLEQQSPGNAEFALRGIDNNSYYPGDYSFESGYDGVPLTESLYESLPSVGANQWDESVWISGPNHPRPSPRLGPWNVCALGYGSQSYASDMVEEGPAFVIGCNLASSDREPSSDFNQRAGSASGIRIGAQNSFPSQGSQQLSSTSHLWAYREDELADDCTPSSISPASTCSPIPYTKEKIPNHGGRKGGLTEDGRANARVRRQQGCCSRCFFMREQCIKQPDGVCKRCREVGNKYRTWELPCSYNGLESRSEYMSPNALVFKLRGDHVTAFVRNNIVSAPDCRSFEISLSLGSGIPLRFDAIEVLPRHPRTMRMTSFGLADDHSLEPTELDSPPILPYVLDRILISTSVNNWIDRIIREPDSDFLEDCFPEPFEVWEKEMLTIITHYHQDHIPDLEPSGEGPFQTLRWALKMVALNHILSRPLVVPEGDVEALSRQLKHYKIVNINAWICPRLTNRIIKHMLLPLFQYAARRVLRDLASSKMLRAKGGENLIWDQAFSIVFLCLVVVGKTQASLVECAELGKRDNDPSFSFQNAKLAIIDMEAELSTYLIGWFHHRFGTSKKRNGNGRNFNPLARNFCDRPDFDSDLAERVRSAIDSYGGRLVNPADLQQADLGKMKKENVMRLLGRFMLPFFHK